MSKSNLSGNQVLQYAYDPTSEGLKVVPQSGSLVNTAYDYIAVTYPSASSEQYEYKLGGSGGTVVATVLVTYTDATKTDLLSVSKT